ncbi:MAG TPA: FHA domain-containing protein [bacterium]|nr:FHA domain-containing protein [bacterium]
MQSAPATETLRRLAPGPGDQEITLLGDDAKAKELPGGIMVLLRVLEGQEKGKGYQVGKVPVSLGRDALCDISINDTRLSRQHAMLFYYSPNFYFKDLGSTNGTFVNDRRIKESAIKNGDHIKIGGTVLELIVSDTGAEAAG